MASSLLHYALLCYGLPIAVCDTVIFIFVMLSLCLDSYRKCTHFPS